MKATLSLEYIGEAHDARLSLYGRVLDEAAPGLGAAVIGHRRPRKPWIARILGRNPKFGYQREFLPANWQRSRSNAAHTRGVELWFVLESGAVYEVSAPVSWRRTDRYHCRVKDDGSIERIDAQQVEAWLNDQSA